MLLSNVQELVSAAVPQMVDAHALSVSVRSAASTGLGTTPMCVKGNFTDQDSSSSRSVCTSFGLFGEPHHTMQRPAGELYDVRQACRPARTLARQSTTTSQHSMDLHPELMRLQDNRKIMCSSPPVLLQDDWVEQTWRQQQLSPQLGPQDNISSPGWKVNCSSPGLQSSASQPEGLQVCPPGVRAYDSTSKVPSQQAVHATGNRFFPDDMLTMSGRDTSAMGYHMRQDGMWEGLHSPCTEPYPMFIPQQHHTSQHLPSSSQRQQQREDHQGMQGMVIIQARSSLSGNTGVLLSQVNKRQIVGEAREGRFACKRQASSASHMEESLDVLQQRPTTAFVKGAAAACVNLAASIALPSSRALPASNRNAGISVKAEDTGKLRSSRFRGVTKHRRSGRWEAHIWVKEIGRQVYLGGYMSEEHAAEAYDVAALKCKGTRVKTNFEVERYTDLMACMDHISLDELIMAVRRQSQGFSRGSSLYRGVSAHPSSRWESRIGVPGSKHIYLGLFEEERDAAAAYDRSLIRLRGSAAATNFGLSDYRPELAEYHQMQQAILLGDPRMEGIQNGPDFERWIKLGASAFPFIAAIIQAGAGCGLQESDTSSHSPSPTMTTPPQQSSWLNLAHLPPTGLSGAVPSSMFSVSDFDHSSAAASSPVSHSHLTSVNDSSVAHASFASTHTTPMLFHQHDSSLQGPGIQERDSPKLNGTPKRMGLRVRSTPPTTQPQQLPLRASAASPSFPEQPSTPPLSQLLASWTDTAAFDLDFMHNDSGGGGQVELAGGGVPELGETGDANSEQMLSSLLSELGGQGDGTTKDVWNW